MGGESFAIGDRHLKISPFFEAQARSESSPSLLANVQLSEQNTNPIPSLLREQLSTPSHGEDWVYVNVPVVELSVSPLPIVQSVLCRLPTVGSPCPIPSGSGSHPQHRIRNARRRLIGSRVQSHPLPNTTTSKSRRSRRTHASPPSQQRSRFTRVLERVLAIEEQQLEINRRNSEIFETFVNGTMQKIEEGFKLLAEILKK